MKIPREAMTPALDAALRTFVGDGVWFRTPGTTGVYREPDRARDLLNLFADLQGGVSIGIGVSVVLGTIFGILTLAGENGLLLAIPALATLGTLFYSRWIAERRPDGPTPTSDFLAAALPRLSLPPVARRYAEALTAIYSGRARDPGGEGLALLRSLANEEERLLALAPTVVGARAPQIDAEAAALRARLAQVRDEAAREALGQSLALAERRTVAAVRADAVRERLDAHRSLLDQAAAAASETIFGRGESAPDLDDLRRNVSSLGREVTALETAVQEMRAL